MPVLNISHLEWYWRLYEHITDRNALFKFGSQWLYPPAKAKIKKNLGSAKMYRETLTDDHEVAAVSRQ